MVAVWMKEVSKSFSVGSKYNLSMEYRTARTKVVNKD